MLYVENPMAELGGNRKYAHHLNSWELDPMVNTVPSVHSGARLQPGGYDQNIIAVGELRNVGEVFRYERLVGGVCNHNEKSFILESVRLLIVAGLAREGVFAIVAKELTDQDPSPRPPRSPAMLPAVPSGRAPTPESVGQAASLAQDLSVTFRQPDSTIAQDRGNRSIGRAPGPPSSRQSTHPGGASRLPLGGSTESSIASNLPPGGSAMAVAGPPHRSAGPGFVPGTGSISSYSWEAANAFLLREPGEIDPLAERAAAHLASRQQSRDIAFRQSQARDGGGEAGAAPGAGPGAASGSRSPRRARSPPPRPATEASGSRGTRLMAMAREDHNRPRPRTPYSGPAITGPSTFAGPAGNAPPMSPARASRPVKAEPAGAPNPVGFVGPQPQGAPSASGSATQDKPPQVSGPRRWGPPKDK